VEGKIQSSSKLHTSISSKSAPFARRGKRREEKKRGGGGKRKEEMAARIEDIKSRRNR